MQLYDEEQWEPDVFPFTDGKDAAEAALSVRGALRVSAIRTLVATKEHPGNRALVSRIVRERRSSFPNTDLILSRNARSPASPASGSAQTPPPRPPTARAR